MGNFNSNLARFGYGDPETWGGRTPFEEEDKYLELATQQLQQEFVESSDLLSNVLELIGDEHLAFIQLIENIALGKQLNQSIIELAIDDLKSAACSAEENYISDNLKKKITQLKESAADVW